MIRVVWICLFTVATAAAQDAATPPALAALEQTVKERTAAWTKLSQNLEPLIIRLLPCDPKAAAAIAEVTKASDARLAAIAAYLDAANRQAQQETDAARLVLASVQALKPDLAAEKADVAPERTSVEGQIANLTQSAQHRVIFTPAQDALRQISTEQQQRSDAMDSAINHANSAAAAVGDLIMQLQARQAAWANVQTAFASERTRWDAYYVAREARAQTECDITRGLLATPTRPAAAAPRDPGKQK